MYGNKMASMWGDCPKADLMDAWRTGMEGLTSAQIKGALDTMLTAYPDWPPTLGQFLSLCKPVVPAAHRPFVSLPRQKHDKIPADIKEKIDSLIGKWRAA